MDAQDKPARMSPVDAVTALFTAPAKLMANIKLYPVSFLPLMICVVITVLYLPLTGRLTAMVFDMNEPALRATYESMGIDPDMGIQQARQMSGGAEVNPITAVTQVAFMIVSVLFSSLGMLLIGKAAKSGTAFKQYFSMYSWLQIIAVIGSAAVTALCLAFRTQTNLLSLAAFMPSVNAIGAVSILNIALSACSLPNLWVTILAVVGLKVFNDWKWSTAIIVGAASFALSIAAGYALSVIPSMLLGMGAPAR